MHQANELIKVARAHAGRANVELFEASGRSAPQQALEGVHNILCDAITILEDGAMGSSAAMSDACCSNEVSSMRATTSLIA